MNYRELRARLIPLYGENEARAVADMLLGEAFGMTKADILCGAVERLGADDTARLASMLRRLLAFEPVQYVLGFADFCGRRFKTASGVLIPRPETEELCAWITADNSTLAAPNILDIGTGSGCIACTLTLDIPQSRVSAWDTSAPALAIAAENARLLNARVDFSRQDALRKTQDNALWDIIVSNPPYICNKERASMHRNVTDHEPHSALFVPDSEPLLFYHRIALYAATALKPQGCLYFEINPLYASELRAMLVSMGFNGVEIRPDSYGKLRMAKAVSCSKNDAPRLRQR